MKREYISGATTWAEADAHFEAFIASLPERREQLVRRLAETGGPALDGTVEGLDALNEWYIATTLADEPDGMDWLPTWLPISGEFGRSPYGTGHRYDVPADPTSLRFVTTNAFEQAAEQLRTNPPPWQRAPTGPDAHRRTTTRPF